MRCKVVKVTPNTEEWDALRRGRLTASRAPDWCAKPTTKRYRQYMQEIVYELLGLEEQEASGPWFDHGKAMEPFARGAYAWKTGIDLDHEVMLIHPEYDWLSASPDGVWPDRDGMVEIKCRAKLSTYQQVVERQRATGNIEAGYRHQVQCQMLVSGLTRIDFVNYYHDQGQLIRKMDIFPVERDDKLIATIEEKAIEFITECYKIAEIRFNPRRKPCQT